MTTHRSTSTSSRLLCCAVSSSIVVLLVVMSMLLRSRGGLNAAGMRSLLLQPTMKTNHEAGSNGNIPQQQHQPTAASDGHTTVVVSVSPNERVAAVLPCPGEAYVHLTDLAPTDAYELRLSFPGSPPVDYDLSLMPLVFPGPRDPAAPCRTCRRILDTAKLWIPPSAGADGSPLDVPRLEGEGLARWVRVTTSAGAPMHPDEDPSDWRNAHLVVALRPLIWGGLVPRDALVAVAVVVGVALPLCLCLMHRLVYVQSRRRTAGPTVA